MRHNSNSDKKEIIISDGSEDSLINQPMPRKRVKIDNSDSQQCAHIKFEANKNNDESEELTNKITSKMIAPWMEKQTKQIDDSLLRLHNEIIDFYNYIKPSQREHNEKLQAFNELKNLINKIFPLAEVVTFGSFSTQLYLPDGDVDVAVLTGSHYQVIDVYNRINRKLNQDRKKYVDLQYIRKSKVPLIKFYYKDTGIQFDISVDKADGIHQVQYVRKMSKAYPEFKYLVFVFKCFLKVRGLGDTYTGGIGSFLLFCMILIYLQDVHTTKKYYTLSEHAIKFMIFYGETDWSHKVIYVKSGMIGRRERFDDYCTFSCLSPQDQAHDIGRSAFKIKDTFNVFRNRGRYIHGKNFEAGISILKELINPNDQKFKYYGQKIKNKGE